MANILITIIVWELFQALATVLIFILLTKILKKWTKDDSKKNKQIKKGFTLLIILIVVFTILSGFYVVKTSENVVLTKFTGKKVIIKGVGIHYSFLSTRDSIDLREQILTFPGKERFEDSDTILTKDKIPIRISGILNYKITDSEIWALKIKNPDEQLFYKLNSIIIQTIKQKDYLEITTNREKIEQEIFDEINQQGIEKISFKFIKTSDSLDVINAKSKAESDKIKTRSLIEQSISEAQSYKILQDSLKDFTYEQLEYLKTKMLSDSGSVKWVISDGGQVIVNSND